MSSGLKRHVKTIYSSHSGRGVVTVVRPGRGVSCGTSRPPSTEFSWNFRVLLFY